MLKHQWYGNVDSRLVFGLYVNEGVRSIIIEPVRAGQFEIDERANHMRAVEMLTQVMGELSPELPEPERVPVIQEIMQGAADNGSTETERGGIKYGARVMAGQPLRFTIKL